MGILPKKNNRRYTLEALSALLITENTLRLRLPLRASEIYRVPPKYTPCLSGNQYVSEVHFVSEVSPCGEVLASLTSITEKR